MKELTIQEKAKAYDEVIKKLRDFYRDYDTVSCLIDVKKELANLIPELAEDKDEMIRKELISFFTERAKYTEDSTFNGLSSKDILTWLETQGAHKKFRDSIQIGDNVTRNEDGVLVNLSQLKRVAKKDEKQDEQRSKLVDFDLNANDSDLQEATYFIPNGFNSEIIGDKVVIKKGEQKPAGVEPKFKVGDWVVSDDKDVHDDYRVCKITKIDDGRYYIEGGDFLSKSSLVQYGYRLWTIQDAKDGDVLVCTDDGYNSYILFGEKNTHCWYNGQTEHFYPTTSCKIRKDATIYPATKEQRDLLFKKIKETGSEWDADKKELKKINNTYCD